MSESSEQKFHVFISHATANAGIAQRIVQHLERIGVRCWIAPRDIEPGVAWAESIIHGIEACSVFVLVLSRKSILSKQVLREVERAIEREAVIVPFRIENVELSRGLKYYLSTIQWLDAADSPADKGIQRLVEVVRSILTGRQHPLAQSLIEGAKRVPVDQFDRYYRQAALRAYGPYAAIACAIVLALAWIVWRPFSDTVPLADHESLAKQHERLKQELATNPPPNFSAQAMPLRGVVPTTDETLVVRIDWLREDIRKGKIEFRTSQDQEWRYTPFGDIRIDELESGPLDIDIREAFEHGKRSQTFRVHTEVAGQVSTFLINSRLFQSPPNAMTFSGEIPIVSEGGKLWSLTDSPYGRNDSGDIKCLAGHPNSDEVAALYADGSLVFYRGKKVRSQKVSEEAWDYDVAASDVVAMSLHPAKPMIAAATSRGEVLLLNSSNGTLERTLPFERAKVWDLGFSTTGTTLYITYGTSITRWDTQSWKKKDSHTASGRILTDDDFAFKLSYRNGFDLSRLNIGNNLGQPVETSYFLGDEGYSPPRRSLAVSPDGRQIVTTHTGGLVMFYTAASGDVLRRFVVRSIHGSTADGSGNLVLKFRADSKRILIAMGREVFEVECPGHEESEDVDDAD